MDSNVCSAKVINETDVFLINFDILNSLKKFSSIYVITIFKNIIYLFFILQPLKSLVHFMLDKYLGNQFYTPD